MAKFLSQVYTSIRGKVGGIVYTKNQFAGLIARAFTAPTNPGTEGQTLIRSSFDRASVEWTGLSQSERDDWSDYAATLDYQGPHGSYKLPGRQVFMGTISMAAFMEELGLGSVVVDTTPPLIAGFLNPGPVTVGIFAAVSATGIAVDIGNGTGEAITAFVQRSFAFNQTRGVWRGPWLFDKNLGLDIPDQTTGHLEIPDLTDSQAYFTRIVGISSAGPLRISTPFFLRHIAVTNGP